MESKIKQKIAYLNSNKTCEQITIEFTGDIEKLSSYYLVWYNLNEKGLNGFDKKIGSYNYTLHDF